MVKINELPLSVWDLTHSRCRIELEMIFTDAGCRVITPYPTPDPPITD
jgi:hypothetical protein